jgi:DMSO/TMAO reductase YedYZ molybdopterin-dependent catalytic subunit
MSSGGRMSTRVQRVPSSWPVVHLEAEPPAWDGLVVEGMVRHRRRFSLAELHALAEAAPVALPLHCVWGWSRPHATWAGVGLDVVLDVVGAEGGFVTVVAGSDTYSACLPVADARRGVLAWERDGEPLGADAGGPLRYVGPSDYWAYKGVKWAAKVVVGDRFVAGSWESKVADPVGRIPEEVVLP